MSESKYIFTFIITTFLLLSIVGAGVFVDDEWVSAQQLKQLWKGNQITYNEGTYGYYANGSIGTYFEYRDNRLMYSMGLPIASLPIYVFIKLCGDFFRDIIIILWGLFGLITFWNLKTSKNLQPLYSDIGIGIIMTITLLNGYLYTRFPTTGIFTPTEVLAIVTTNIILFGIFTVFLHKIIDQLFDHIRLKAFVFLTTLSCTSLIFWVGACKDHILSCALAMIIIYYLIIYEQKRSVSALSIALFVTGLLVWERIELGIGILLGISIYLFLYHLKDVLNNKIPLLITFLIGTIPLWINNYLTTGSALIHPFMTANAQVYMVVSAEDNLTSQFIVSQSANPLWVTFHTLFAPLSGAVALLPLIPLIIIVIPAYILKRVKLSRTDILLLIIALSSCTYYILFSGKYMHADMGIMPDMRYFIFFYTAITLFMLSVINKILPELKYKKMIIYCLLLIGLLFILFTTYSATLSEGGTYRDLNKIVNTLATVCMGIGLIAVINDIRLNKNYLTYILPLMIAIPMAWQLTMLFIYHTSKAHSYPMFLPITEFIYNYIFGLIP
jgi:hypothetical protein